MIAAKERKSVTRDKPAVGKFGAFIVETILPKFCEKKIFRRQRLTLGKYLGAYLIVATQGVLLGLRFRHAPLSMVKLVCQKGSESDLAEFLRKTASQMTTEFDQQEVDFLGLTTFKERERILAQNPDRQLTDHTVLDIEVAFRNLSTCFTVFLALGLFESDWIKEVYLRFIPGEAQLQEDSRHLGEFVKDWVSELQPSLLEELFSLSAPPQ